MEPLFILGTGRCGSTMLSSMLQDHPSLASISEFFSFVTDLGCRVAESFPAGVVSGEDFWALVGTPWPRQNLMLRHDVAMDEVCYPWKDGRFRFGAQSGVPAISQTTLPHLGPDPDALFDAVASFCQALPAAPIATQYARLFAWLAEQKGAVGWVERSGGSLRVVRRLRAAFPQARYVHLVRDGRDVALSMSRHTGFRMVFACFQLLEMLGVDPFVSEDRRWEEDLPDDLAALLPERFTREAFLAFDTPPPLCGHYWSGELIAGLQELEGLGPDRLLTLRYEDFMETPSEAVERFSAFLGHRSAAWERRAAAKVGRGHSRWQNLPEPELRELNHACAPGREAMARYGITWEA